MLFALTRNFIPEPPHQRQDCNGIKGVGQSLAMENN